MRLLPARIRQSTLFRCFSKFQAGPHHTRHTRGQTDPEITETRWQRVSTEETFVAPDDQAVSPLAPEAAPTTSSAASGAASSVSVPRRAAASRSARADRRDWRLDGRLDPAAASTR